jgi:predicted RNase H-like HicB family nuclease
MLTQPSQNLYSRKVILSQDEDGYFVVEVPSLPGCISQGKTRNEALENIKEAIDLHIEVLQERGEPVLVDTVEVVVLP